MNTNKELLPQWVSSEPISILQGNIKSKGISFFEDVTSEDQFLHISAKLGEIYRHPDSEPSGLTRVRNKTHPSDSETAADHNRLGFTDEGLYPHTDRSGTLPTPRLVGLWFDQQASVGGDCVLVDGHRVFSLLSVRDHEAMKTLLRPRSAIFRSEDGLLESSIFEIKEETLTVRFRNDRLLYLSTEALNALPAFLELIRECAVVVKVGRGSGYFIENTRWLHGRTAFVGQRSACRILIS